MIELACRSASCAPPPIGSGGSLPAGSSSVQLVPNPYAGSAETFGSVIPVIPKSLVAWAAETGGPAARLVGLESGSAKVFDEEYFSHIQRTAQGLQEYGDDSANARLWQLLTNTQQARMALSAALRDPDGPTDEEQQFYQLVHDAYLQRSSEVDEADGHPPLELQRVTRSADSSTDPFAPNQGWKSRSPSPDTAGTGITSWYASKGFKAPNAPVMERMGTNFFSGWVSKSQVLGRFGDTDNELLVARDASIIQRLTGRSATTASGVIELACRSKGCAPPPVGTGGSIAGEFDIEWVEVRSDEEYPTSADLDQDQSVWDNRVPKIPEPLLEWISETGGPYQRLKGTEHDLRIWEAKGWVGTLRRGDSATAERDLYGVMTQTQEARRALSLALHDPDGPTPQEAQWYSFVHQAYLERSAQLGTPKDLQYVDRDADPSASDPFAPNRHWKSQSEAPDAAGTGLTSWFGVTDPPSDQPPKAGLVVSGRTSWGSRWRGWVSKDQVLGVFGDTPGELLVARDSSIIDRLTGKAATTASATIELACRSKACAPPPVGTGGSVPGELPGLMEWVSGVEAEGQIPAFDPESEVGQRIDELIATFEAERDDRVLQKVDGRWESVDLDSLPTGDPTDPEVASARWSMLTQTQESRKWLSRTVREGASGPDLVILQAIHENFRRRFLNPDTAKVPINRIGDANDPTDDPFAPGAYWKRESADPDAAGTGLTSWTWGRKEWESGRGFDFRPYEHEVEEEYTGGWSTAKFWTGDVPVSDVLGWFGDMAWEGEIIVGRPGLVQRLLKGEPSDKANAALAASAVTELACRSAECAPPPTGTGGSSPAGTSSGSGSTSGVTEEGLKGREKLHEAILPDDESEPDAWRKAVDIMSAGITEDSAQQFADVFTKASSDGAVRAALAGASLDADAGLRSETIGQLNSTLIERAGKQWNADDYQPVLTASGMAGLKSPDLSNYTRFISHDSKSKTTHVYYLHNGLKNEDGGWEIPEELTEFGGPTDATGTDSLGARRAVAAAIRGAWANSARSPLSNLASQEVASMGLASQSSWDSLQGYLGTFGTDQMSALSTAMRPAVSQAVKAAYDATQADLKQRGITSVTLYRGAAYEQLFTASSGADVPLREAPLTSWSTDPYIADDFANYSRGRVLEMTVPASRIFSTAQTGLGSQLEWEAVLLGSDGDEATIYDRRQDNKWGAEKPVAASASASDDAVLLDADPDHHDWIKVVSRIRRPDADEIMSAITAACRSKACAPPPIGTGGSVSSGYAEAISEVRRRYGPGTKPRNRARIGEQMHNLLDLRFSKSPPPSDDEVWEILTESKEARSMVSRALKVSDPDPLAIMVMQEMHRQVVAEMPEHAQVMVWRSGRPDSDPFAPRSGPHGTVLRSSFDANTGTGVTSWWGPPPTDGSKPEDDYRIRDQVRAGIMNPGESFQHKFRREAEQRPDRQVYEEWVGRDRILGRLGDMRHSGEVLVAHTPETIDRLMSGTFPIVPAENRVSDWGTVGSANVIELACRSKSCAPPPVGSGGSLSVDDFAWDGTTVPMSTRFAERKTAIRSDVWLAEVPVLPRPLLEWAATGANLDDLPSRRGTSGKGAKIAAETAQRILDGEDTPELHAELWYGLVLTGTSRKALSRAIHEGPSVEEQGLLRIVHEHYLRAAEGLVGDGDAQPVQRYDGNNEYQEGQEPIGPFDPSSHWKGRGARPDSPGSRITSWFGGDHVPYGYPIESTTTGTGGARQRWVGDVSKRQVLGRFGDTVNELLVAESPEIIDRLLGRDATTASAAIELACRSKECAPPPIGRGGSLPAEGGAAPLNVDEDALGAMRASQNANPFMATSYRPGTEVVRMVQKAVQDNPVALRMGEEQFVLMAAAETGTIGNIHEDFVQDAGVYKNIEYMAHRRSYDTAVGLMPLRTVHGYSEFSGLLEGETSGLQHEVAVEDTEWYGDIRITLADDVKKRSYFTVSDSLDTLSVPTPVYGEIDDAAASQQYVHYGTYAEVQIPGPVPWSEIAEIATDAPRGEVSDDFISALEIMVDGGLPKTARITLGSSGEDSETVGEFLMAPQSTFSTAATIELACRSKECAPPPVGKGGSLPKGAPPLDVDEEVYEAYREARMGAMGMIGMGAPVGPEFVKEVQTLVQSSPVAVRMSSEAFSAMGHDDPDPMIRNFYEVEDTDGRSDSYRESREAYDTAVGLKDLRAVHGYSVFTEIVAGTTRVNGDSAAWYGEIQLVLDDSVKDRSYFTVSDSLNSAAVPLPIYGDYIPGTNQVTSGGMGGSYVEVQIPGPIPMSEIAEISVTDGYSIEDSIDPHALDAMVSNGLALDVPIRDEDGTQTVGEYLSDAGLAPATPDEVG